MNAKIIMFSIVVAMASLVTLLQLWLIMIDAPGAQPLWLVAGGMMIIGGLLNIRRERMQ